MYHLIAEKKADKARARPEAVETVSTADMITEKVELAEVKANIQLTKPNAYTKDTPGKDTGNA